jgi:hypothetical protein
MIKKQQSNKLDRVIRALSDAGADVYEVGGPVRDELMDREAKDHDYLVRHLTVRQIQNLLEPFGTVTLIGRSFGVIKFTPHGERSATVDIALPRKEMSTGEGHRDFEVDFDPELTVEEDLGRRDFTINAIARPKEPQTRRSARRAEGPQKTPAPAGIPQRVQGRSSAAYARSAVCGEVELEYRGSNLGGDARTCTAHQDRFQGTHRGGNRQAHDRCKAIARIRDHARLRPANACPA